MKENCIFYRCTIMVIIILSCVVTIIIAHHKDSIFYDEMITFQRSAELFRDSNISWEDESQFINVLLSGKDFTDNLTLMPNAYFYKQPVSKIINQLLFGRPYFFLLNVIESLTQSGFSVLNSIVLNVLFQAFTLVIVYFIGKRVFNDKKCALIALTLYAFSIGVIETSVYYRFYMMWVFYITLHTLLYLELMQDNNTIIKQCVLVILALVTAWYGYRCCQYTAIYAVISLVFFCLIMLFKRKVKRALFVATPFIICGIAFLGEKYSYIETSINNGLLTSTHMNQMAVAFYNIKNRGLSEFLDNLIILRGVAFSELYLYYRGVATILFLLAVVSVIMKKRDKNVDLSAWIYLVLIILCYYIVIAKITPWAVWRYISNTFPLLCICSIMPIYWLKIDTKMKNLIMLAIASLSITLFFRHVSGHFAIVKDASFAQRNEVSSRYDGIDSIYFNDGDGGTLYYGAFLWPQDSNVYVTTVDAMQESTAEKKMILQNSKIMVWVTYKDADKWDSQIRPYIEKNGYGNIQLEYDTGECGRHRIYMCSRY